MNADAFTVIVFALIAAVSGLVGWICGEQRGRDCQWIDDYLDRARKERERRDRYGRFQVTTKTTTQ